MKYAFMKTRLLLLSLFVFQLVWAQDEVLVNDLAPGKLKMDFSTYDRPTSIYCAQISEVAYWKASEIAALQQVLIAKYPGAKYQAELIDYKDKKSHTQALLFGNKHFLVVSFRGTEPGKIKDWISDAKFWNYSNNPSSNEQLANMPAGHGGFRNSLISLITEEDLFGRIDKIMAKCNPEIDKSQYPVYLIGHSLGAAISQLFIEPLSYKGYNFSGAYHFAPPLSVSCTVNDYMKKQYGDKVYDIVNYKDYVPRAGRNGVAHFGKFHRICKDGLVYREKESYIKFRFFEYPSEFRLHSLGNHLKAVRNSKNSLEGIEQRSAGEFPCLRPKNDIDPCLERTTQP